MVVLGHSDLFSVLKIKSECLSLTSMYENIKLCFLLKKRDDLGILILKFSPILINVFMNKHEGSNELLFYKGTWENSVFQEIRGCLLVRKLGTIVWQ